MFYPVGIARVSYFDALGSGATRLLITPVQHRADGTGTATLRKFDGLHLQLFYSSFNDPVTIGGQTSGPHRPPPRRSRTSRRSTTAAPSTSQRT